MDELHPSYTIDEWCAVEKISRSKFYELRRLGTGPDLMRVGSRYRISHEAAIQWRKDRTVSPAL